MTFDAFAIKETNFISTELQSGPQAKWWVTARGIYPFCTCLARELWSNIKWVSEFQLYLIWRKSLEVLWSLGSKCPNNSVLCCKKPKIHSSHDRETFVLQLIYHSLGTLGSFNLACSIKLCSYINPMNLYLWWFHEVKSKFDPSLRHGFSTLVPEWSNTGPISVDFFVF